ncbi:MAG: hypothetical protein ACHP9T_03120 [Caulobacterales bacterium]|jgi:hypothetical protein
MRRFLALIAALAVFVSPMTAVAAQAACRGDAASGMADMPGMAQATPHEATGKPCCDPGASHKMDPRSCAQACAASCAVVAALPTSAAIAAPAFMRISLSPGRPEAGQPHQPAGLKRPPKSMA